MSDDLSKKIKQITDILGQENLKEILNLLTSGSENSNKSEGSQPKQSADAVNAPGEELEQKRELNENLELINRVKTLMDRVKSDNDPRINLLTAIKPFLNNTRQKKLSNCIKILQMSNLVRYLDEQEK